MKEQLHEMRKIRKQPSKQAMEVFRVILRTVVLCGVALFFYTCTFPKISIDPYALLAHTADGDPIYSRNCAMINGAPKYTEKCYLFRDADGDQDVLLAQLDCDNDYTYAFFIGPESEPHEPITLQRDATATGTSFEVRSIYRNDAGEYNGDGEGDPMFLYFNLPRSYSWQSENGYTVSSYFQIGFALNGMPMWLFALTVVTAVVVIPLGAVCTLLALMVALRRARMLVIGKPLDPKKPLA